MMAPPEAYWSREGERSGTADGYFIAGVSWCRGGIEGLTRGAPVLASVGLGKAVGVGGRRVTARSSRASVFAGGKKDDLRRP